MSFKSAVYLNRIFADWLILLISVSVTVVCPWAVDVNLSGDKSAVCFKELAQKWNPQRRHIQQICQHFGFLFSPPSPIVLLLDVISGQSALDSSFFYFSKDAFG